MAFNMKTAAERLLKLADVLEKEAHDKTFFVCDRCNHTASLSSINLRRKEASERLNKERVASMTVTAVSVNDKLACPAPGCDGTMSYVATDESERYYMDEDQNQEGQTPSDVPPPPPPPTEEKKVPPAMSESIDPEKIFEPVDEQGVKPDEEELDLSFGPEDVADVNRDTERTKTDQDVDLGTSTEDKVPETPEKPLTPEESPANDKVPTDKSLTITENIPTDEIKPQDEESPSVETPVPEDKFIPETPMDESPSGKSLTDEIPAEVPTDESPSSEMPSDVSEETDQPLVETPPGYEEEAPKAKKKKQDLEYPKKPLPKFEKMPKDASDDFVEAVVRYSL